MSGPTAPVAPARGNELLKKLLGQKLPIVQEPPDPLTGELLQVVPPELR